MACDLSLGRKEPCKDVVGGIKNIYFVNIPIVDNEEIVSYFTNKRDVLLKHLDDNTIPRRCDEKETWNGKKCEKYCEVRGLCPYVNGLGE